MTSSPRPKYRIISLSDRFADLVRETMVAPGYGHPAHREVATSYGPCRVCLETFEAGEENRILFTHNPFGEHENLPLPGPIFIHEARCTRYPKSADFPDALRAIPMTLNAYASGRRLLAQEPVLDGKVEPKIERLLDDLRIDYIHVRNREAGCYMLRIERISG